MFLSLESQPFVLKFIGGIVIWNILSSYINDPQDFPISISSCATKDAILFAKASIFDYSVQVSCPLPDEFMPEYLIKSLSRC